MTRWSRYYLVILISNTCESTYIIHQEYKHSSILTFTHSIIQTGYSPHSWPMSNGFLSSISWNVPTGSFCVFFLWDTSCWYFWIQDTAEVWEWVIFIYTCIDRSWYCFLYYTIQPCTDRMTNMYNTRVLQIIRLLGRSPLIHWFGTSLVWKQ